MRYVWMALLLATYGFSSRSFGDVHQVQKDLLLSTLFSEELETARVGATSIVSMYRNDQEASDLLAESLMHSARSAMDRKQLRTLYHRLNAFADLKDPRYRTAILRTRDWVSDEDYQKKVDAVVASFATNEAPQYESGSVNWELQRNQMFGRLKEQVKTERSKFDEVREEMSLPDLLSRLGVPDAVSGITQYGKWGRSATLVVHYVGTGAVSLRFDSRSDTWLVYETARQVAPVSQRYSGNEVGLVNMIACFRGYAFRNLMKYFHQPIVKDAQVIDFLVLRLVSDSYESDKFDNDGLRVGVQLVAMAKDDKTKERLQTLASHAASEGARKDANAYLRKLEKIERRAAAHSEALN